MKNKLNTIFFSICLMAALLMEAYCIIVLEGEPVSTIGVGIVILITSYLLLDSIRECMNQGSQRARFFFEQIYHEDTEKWNDRCFEILKLQKATYSAAKRNTAMLEDRLEQIIISQEKISQAQLTVLEQIADLQNKFLEGQRNALNIEVNYNNKNTKRLLQTIQEEIHKLDNKDQLTLLIKLLEQNKTESVKARDKGIEDIIETDKISSYNREDVEPYETMDSEYSDDIRSNTEGEDPISKESIEIVPLYDDPNKALTTDEIAALFSSYGK